MRVSSLGGSSVPDAVYEQNRQVGRLLGTCGHNLVCGGRGGVMEAACRGAQEAGGHTIGILPGSDRTAANPDVDTVIATGMGQRPQCTGRAQRRRNHRDRRQHRDALGGRARTRLRAAGRGSRHPPDRRRRTRRLAAGGRRVRRIGSDSLVASSRAVSDPTLYIPPAASDVTPPGMP